jgi:hypothetical protein
VSYSRGCIVGCCAKMEYLLPYFYINFRLNSEMPIVFFDFGMTSMGRSYCEKRGAVITIDDSLYDPKSDTQLELIKTMWFKKPLAFKQTPFEETLWLDLDCKIFKPFDDIFETLGNKWISLLLEKKSDLQKIPCFNSGVCVFKKNAPFIKMWIKESIQKAEYYKGDQDALSFILKDHLDHISILPQKFNYLYSKKGSIRKNNVVIVHYFSLFKTFLQKEYLMLEKNSHLSVLDPIQLELS